MEERGRLDRGDGVELAWLKQSGQSPTIVFLPGFGSEMQGEKGNHLARFAATHDRSLLRLDYSGHGTSDGEFVAGSIGRWAEDARIVIEHASDGPLVLVGSSMGGWIALLTARALAGRVVGMVGVAAAPDFTEELMWGAMTPVERERLLAEGSLTIEGTYDRPLVITRTLIEDGRRHLLLGGPIAIGCPVRLLHGQQDHDVPWQTALRIAEHLASSDVRVTLIKDGEHRLSRPGDLALLTNTLTDLLAELSGKDRRG